jgi:hypothetical protein
MDGQTEFTPAQIAHGRKILRTMVRSICAIGMFWIGATAPWSPRFGLVIPILAFGSGIHLIWMAMNSWRQPIAVDAVKPQSPIPDAASESN